ncbi:hypothetical protein QBC40DRAFT_98935 [Triangularia verruculosa]|uniref:Pathway-specific nitrogen regulator n=1 Tax=Triangularia verruculosa TaxID=2587418 RepID=A0AAN6XCA8_9PEZI|nr:hypothetical protein QBC40DRAFT_98935 [Triangularia verruculosa]
MEACADCALKLEQEPQKPETVTPETKPDATPTENMEGEESDATSTYSGRDSPDRRESISSLPRHHLHSRTASEDTADNSSHNGDDVFSERGSRSQSSVGSVDGRNDDSKTPQGKDSQSRRESYTSSRNSESRNSDRAVSRASTMSQYEKEADFVPNRSTRLSIRTPSEAGASQMGSPTPSVFDGSSARSNKRHSGTPAVFPTVSRVGSPTVQVQYSPKGRTTPSRFKVRTEAPLVLLHVTLLPLRWVWGETLNGLDLVSGKVIDEGGLPYEASDEIKTLRDSWRELQDRLGDTVLERGILLPHPQSDFEVLEERLLEALELPFKRRARILECGHYLGPANVTAEEDDESELGFSRSVENRHWCKQCKTEIRYEKLGSNKIFRVKVYASNGLMKSGAWEACWREMERVDCEVELTSSPAMQQELEKVAVFQLEQEEQRQRDLLLDAEAAAKAGAAAGANTRQSRPTSALHVEVHPSTPEPPMEPLDRVTSPEFLQPPSTSRPRSRQEDADESEERRLRDEERMREIYGDMPPPEPIVTPEPTAERNPFTRPASSVDEGYQSVPVSQALVAITPTSSLDQPSTLRDRHPDSYNPPPTPLSPSEIIRERREEYERRQAERAQKRQRELQNAGVIDLLTEAFRVALDNAHETVKDGATYVTAGALVARDFFSDPKNVAIVVLLLLVVVIGLGNRQQDLAPAMYKSEPRSENHVIEKAPEAKIEASVLEATAGLASTEAAAMGLGGVVYGAASDPPVQPQSAVVEDTPTVKVEAETEVLLVQSIEAAVDKNVESTAVEAAPVVEKVEEVPVEMAETVLPGANTSAEATDASVELVLASGPKVELQPAQNDVTVSKAAEKPESGVELYGSAPTTEEETPVPAVENEKGVEIFGAEPPKAEAEEYGLEQVVVGKVSTTEENSLEQVVVGGKQPDTAESGLEQVVVGKKAEEYGLEQVVVGKRHSTVIDFIPGPFVTQHKTVRVFETVTEIVRVSVVTKTQTVSRVVTAIPQTVEQTVYETETVKITVSLPVEEEEKTTTTTETKKPSPTRRRFW